MATEFNKVALSINAHPDDAEAWNAGALKLLHDRGYKIVIATMTGGDLGGCNMSMEETARVRYEEAKAAAAASVSAKERISLLVFFMVFILPLNSRSR